MLDDQDDDLRSLYTAMQAKNTQEMVHILRDNSQLIRYRNHLGETLLHMAVECNFEEIIECLINHGLNIDSIDKCNRTALHSAITTKNEVMVRCLLKHNASTRIKNLYGKSPFHLAVNLGDRVIIQLLLLNGADVMDNTLYTHQTSLHIALRNEDEITFKLLLNNYSGNVNISDVYGETILHHLARQKNEKLVKLLIEKGGDVNFINQDDETPLHFAIHRRNFSVCKILIENNADVNIKNKFDESPLHLAVRNKDIKLVDLLLDFNANVNQHTNDCDTMLHVAINYYNPTIVDLLIKKQIDIDSENKYGLTPFHTAIKIKCLDGAEQLLHHAVDVNTLAFGQFIRKGEPQYYTPLQTAIVQKDYKTVKLLLDHGALFDNDREIFLAVEFGCVNIVDLLIQNGANVNAKNSTGQSVLYTAMKSRDRDKVEMLLHRGANRYNVDETDNDENKESALHLAVKAKDEKFVKFLLDIGVDVNVCDVNEMTALCLANGNIANLIIASVALLKANGFYVCKKNESLISIVHEFNLYFNKCMDELERIGMTRYGDVSLIKFLRDDVRFWGKYVRKGVFTTMIDENFYPTYWEKLSNNIDKGLTRWKLIKRVKDNLCEFQCFQTLYDVMDDIVDNLNDDELNSFIHNFNEESIITI